MKSLRYYWWKIKYGWHRYWFKRKYVRHIANSDSMAVETYKELPNSRLTYKVFRMAYLKWMRVKNIDSAFRRAVINTKFDHLIQTLYAMSYKEKRWDQIFTLEEYINIRKIEAKYERNRQGETRTPTLRI